MGIMFFAHMMERMDIWLISPGELMMHQVESQRKLCMKLF